MSNFDSSHSNTLTTDQGLSTDNLDNGSGESITSAANYSDSDGMIIGLNAWIDAAIQTVKTSAATSGHKEEHNNNIVCSQEYLSCALKIAHSLADQLCVVDEEKTVTLTEFENGDDGGGITTLDPSIINEIMAGPPDHRQSQLRIYESLAPSIYVRCGADRLHVEKKDDVGSTNTFPKDDLEPLPFHPARSSDPDDLGILGQQLSSLLEGDSEHNIEYSNVICAALREDVFRDLCINDDARMAAIHALGSTFVQLFSGGQQVLEVVETVEQYLGTEYYDRPDHVSKKTQRRSPSCMLSSIEQLKSLGLSNALCDLIGNMLDCTSSDVTADESYKAVTNIRDDLKLMMDSPEVYLRDLDMMHASSVGLQMRNIGRKGNSGHASFYGRKSELKMLKESYQRSISSGCEVAMIYGSSGIGKSMLSNKFAEHVSARSGVFLSGSFDKLQQSQPFHAISSAFDEYCTLIAAFSDKSTIELVSTALQRELGDEMSSLVAAMPNLRDVLGSDFVCGDSDEIGDIAVDAQKRLRYLFCQFVEIILGCQEEPLVLFLDDCQWIDAASVALLNQILMMPNKSATNKQRRFFFFGCCRDDEVNEGHPLILMLSSLETFGTKTTNIMLQSMSRETVNEMVSATLSLLPRLTRPLADILYHKTKGSPFFIKQLMLELYKRRLLYPSLTDRRWVWESDNIRDIEITDSVATFIMKNSFHCLPSEVLSALCVLSCFGSSASISMIETLEAEIQTPLIAPLDMAVAESIVYKREGSFYFIHDKLHEAAYGAILSEQRCLQHFRYGLALCDVAVRETDDGMLITAVSQINHGGPQAVIDREQGVAVASLNLDAGKKAMKMSDFFSAHSFFDHGISYLRKGHWEEQYDLSLELFNLAAKCALMNAEHAHLEILIQQIMHFARCFEDKCQAIYISITLLFLSGKVLEGVKASLSTLASLGEELNRSPKWVPQIVLNYVTLTLMQKHLNATEAKLAEVSDETLLSYPTMADPSKLMAMELMANLYELLAFSYETIKSSFILSKMIQITLKHGMSPLSPLAFVQYGNYNAFIRQNYEVGMHYVKLGLALMRQSPSRAHDCQIIFLSAYTRSHVEPMQSAIECFLDGFKAAMKSGATRNAMKCAYFYDTCCFWAGKRLDEVAKSMEETMKQMRFHKNLVLISVMLPIVRLTLRLAGESGIPHQNSLMSVFGETHNEGDIADKVCSAMIAKQFIECYEAFVFREFDKARNCAEKYFSLQNLTVNAGSAMYHRIL